jgi:endonuclease/exonuclease/phosphatase family metal-dependent hydrolase
VVTYNVGKAGLDRGLSPKSHVGRGARDPLRREQTRPRGIGSLPAFQDAGSESRRFAVYNTHLEYRAPQSRLPSLQLIVEANSAYPHLPLNDVLAQAGPSRYEVIYRSFVNPAEAARLDYIVAYREFGYREAEVMTHGSRWEAPTSDHHPVRALAL